MAAEKIARLVEKTPTELRGDLFLRVAEILQSKDQFYTASLFSKIAKEYGLDASNQ